MSLDHRKIQPHSYVKASCKKHKPNETQKKVLTGSMNGNIDFLGLIILLSLRQHQTRHGHSRSSRVF